MRRAMASSMAFARDAIAPATLFHEADIESWWASDHDVTTRLIRAVVAACAAVPIANAAYDESAGTLQEHAHVDLGIAVDMPDGLIVPVLRDAGGRNQHGIREASTPSRTPRSSAPSPPKRSSSFRRRSRSSAPGASCLRRCRLTGAGSPSTIIFRFRSRSITASSPVVTRRGS
jgi:pyruvate/2-oxoglutarate dehydrogenase complex dihydrolipoamide acyltransferase (E2) component